MCLPSSCRARKPFPKIPQAVSPVIPAARFFAVGGSAAATNEGTLRARSNPAQWLPLSKAVPARCFLCEGAQSALENPLISTFNAKIFAAARLVAGYFCREQYRR